MKPERYDRRIRIERPVPDTSLDGAGSSTWDLVAETWANVQDMLPSRGERLAEGLNATNRPARVRIRYRPGIDASMRILMGHYERDGNDVLQWTTDRTAQLVTMPAELGHRDGLEFIVEDYSPAGGGA